MSAPDQSVHIMRRFAYGVRHPKHWMTDLCGGEAAFPLLVLFGLNAVDELDRAAFGILLPEIREEFGIDIQTALSLVALSAVAALALQVPIGQFADKSRRIPLVVYGALVWGFFSGMTGIATGLILLTIARSGSALGKAVIDPTHNSLIADYYPVETRSRVYSFHRAANALGAFVGPLSAGLLAFHFGWRTPFFVFVVPTVIFAVLAMRLREPVRGRWERQATGASQEIIDTEEESPSFAESWRTAHKVKSLQRLWWALPFLATSLIGFLTLASLLYEQKFNLDERARGVAAAISEPFQVIIGARIATRRFIGNVKGLVRFLASIAILTSVATVGFVFSPNIVIAVAFNCVISGALAIIGPGMLAALSLAIPPRARATGFAIGSLWVIPGLAVLPLIGWIADNWSIEIGMLVMIPMFVIGSVLLRNVANVIDADIAQVWQSAAARSEVLYDRRQGTTNLLLLKGVEAGYDNRLVLQGIDMRLDEGEIVALLGTNGAGKSTLLKSISGIVEADRGAIVLDGRDITHAPPNEIAALGIVQMPGGQGVFGSLTVKENLELAGWTNRRDPAGVAAATAEVLEMFPVLAERLDLPAANMSGGQQQMLALAMSFVMRPKVLLIDELSLGLAPVVVGQLLPIVRRMADDGVTVILVEQSVNVALTVAERAYFMERGKIMFDGPTAELLERPDLLRSVFLSAAQPDRNGAGSDQQIDPLDRAVIDRTETPVLSVNELSVTFGGIRAVNGATFDVWPREIVGVIGPNGAGKTTVFDLISGFTPLDDGQIVLNGRNITELNSAGRAAMGLGRSFQDARLFPELTVAETLAVAQERFVGSRSVMVAALHLPMVVDSEQQVAMRVDELVELMGLGDYRHKFVRELSTGTRRVVDLACLVAHRPSVILLDEPTSGIAQREVEALAPVIRRLRDEMGASLVIVEHDIPFVSGVSDRLLALEQGQVIATGPPADVLAHPDVIESYLGTSGAAITRSGGTE